MQMYPGNFANRKEDHANRNFCLFVLLWTSILIPLQMQHVNGWVALVAVIVFLYRRDVLFFICKKLVLENDWIAANVSY